MNSQSLKQQVLEIFTTWKMPHASSFSLLFINTLKGFIAYFFDENDKEIGQVNEPGNDNENKPKKLEFGHKGISKIARVEPDGANLIIDNILAIP
ncbi:hypothetical protein [Pseudomonas sp. FP1742]|uniref:hypothetical protein n=1 Tax=Pseudomonas sp. FP1742 TaxID=2954079 RepID=UPI002733D447|nr:hypothetical protein [Pseudomonas sp. FP1742]WLG52424.1 hypothetical protein PSH64_07855 [Pseudomonas sp. FP1742]